MKTSRISLFICTAAILAFACSSAFAQQVNVSKHRQSSSASLYAPGYSSHVSGDLYSSILARYMRDPSSFDLISARWGGVGFAAPRLSAGQQFAAHRFGGINTFEVADRFEAGSFMASESMWGNSFGSIDAFGLQPTTSFAALTFNDPVPAPEPSTWLGAALAFAVVAYSQRRRLLGLVRA